MATERSPGFKLFFAGLVGIVLVIPLLMVYALSSDRQSQAATARASIAAGWGGPAGHCRAGAGYSLHNHQR